MKLHLPMPISKTRKRTIALPIVSTKPKFPKISAIFFFSKLKFKLISLTKNLKLTKRLSKFTKCTGRLKPSTSPSLRKTFSLHDLAGNARVNPENSGSLKRTPSQPQVNEIVNTGNLDGPFDFHRFLGLMRKQLRAKPMDQELHWTLEAIDNDVDGYINVGKLRHVVATMGESLDPDERNELIRAIGNGSDGTIRNEDYFVPMVIA